MVFGTDDGKEMTVWVADLKAGASVRRLTFDGRNMYPIWSRDGRFITFQSDRDGDRGLFRQRADGSGTAERLTKADSGVEHRPEDWSPDGKTLVLLVARGFGDLWTLSLDGDRKLEPLVQLPSNERYAAFSPDGRWFTYASTEIGGRFEVFVQPFPTTGARYQISTDGGRDPVWSPDGRQILYNTGFSASTATTTNTVTGSAAGNLAAVEVRTQPAFSFGRPTPIPIDRAILGENGRYYDVTPDGKQFLVVMPPDAQTGAVRPPAERINVVLNWFEELKQRVPVKR
jgi:Tol biopolymer transport system component